MSEEDSLLLATHNPHTVIDPSTADGSHVIFDRELPFEVRHSDDHDSNLGTLLNVRVKILILYKLDTQLIESVRVELTREDDIFFYMYHSLQERGFLTLQTRQKLMINFQDYAHMLITNFNKCLKDSHNCMIVLYIHRDGNGRMDFIQNMEFKFVELLSVDFLLTPSDVIKQHIIYRYFSMKNQCEMLQNRLMDVNELIKNKSPSLLLQLKKTPMRSSSSTTTIGKNKQALLTASTGVGGNNHNQTAPLSTGKKNK